MSSSVPTLRLGCVPYLNAKPLIQGLSGVELDVPARLAESLGAGRLDCALVPIVEYFHRPDYQIVPGVAIASRGPVRSVYLAYRGALSQLRRVAPDPASRTSSLLMRVVLRVFYELKVEEAPDAEAKLLIGDPALLSRARFQAEGWNLLDLGEEWHEATGLPFVYAAWLLRAGAPAADCIRTLQDAKTRGMAAIDEIARAENRFPEKMVRSYLGGAIRYDLGPEELRGLSEFQRLLAKHGWIRAEQELRMAA
ncbi:MAG: menaquinone biosynthesis protein [Verrucomicrobiae bacterium]|nr:menaquinone biosynthesis protein [Verrucomicrobiae bacterium]